MTGMAGARLLDCPLLLTCKGHDAEGSQQRIEELLLPQWRHWDTEVVSNLAEEAGAGFTESAVAQAGINRGRGMPLGLRPLCARQPLRYHPNSAVQAPDA